MKDDWSSASQAVPVKRPSCKEFAMSAHRMTSTRRGGAGGRKSPCAARWIAYSRACARLARACLCGLSVAGLICLMRRCLLAGLRPPRAEPTRPPGPKAWRCCWCCTYYHAGRRGRVRDAGHIGFESLLRTPCPRPASAAWESSSMRWSLAVRRADGLELRHAGRVRRPTYMMPKLGISAALEVRACHPVRRT